MLIDTYGVAIQQMLNGDFVCLFDLYPVLPIMAGSEQLSAP